jgi:hypothetical protein
VIDWHRIEKFIKYHGRVWKHFGPLEQTGLCATPMEPWNASPIRNPKWSEESGEPGIEDRVPGSWRIESREQRREEKRMNKPT